MTPKEYIITCLIFLIGFLGIVFMHEQAHVQVAEHNGMTWNYWTDYVSVGIITSGCPTKECILANNNVDAIGYHVMPLYASIGLLYIFHIRRKEGIQRKHIPKELPEWQG